MAMQIGTMDLHSLVSWASKMYEKLRGKQFFGVKCVDDNRVNGPTQTGVSDSG